MLAPFMVAPKNLTGDLVKDSIIDSASSGSGVGSSFDRAQDIQDNNNATALENAMLQWFAEQNSADIANKFSAEEAYKSRAWQKDMRQSYYPDLVKSMKAAGLNPSVMFASGSAGSVAAPTGATASGVAGSMSKADTDFGTIRSIFTTMLDNNSAESIALQNNVTKFLTSLIPWSKGSK